MFPHLHDTTAHKWHISGGMQQASSRSSSDCGNGGGCVDRDPAWGVIDLAAAQQRLEHLNICLSNQQAQVIGIVLYCSYKHKHKHAPLGTLPRAPAPGRLPGWHGMLCTLVR